LAGNTWTRSAPESGTQFSGKSSKPVLIGR